MTNRQIGTVLIEYNSELRFHKHNAQVVIPENILKVDETLDTFEASKYPNRPI